METAASFEVCADASRPLPAGEVRPIRKRLLDNKPHPTLRQRHDPPKTRWCDPMEAAPAQDGEDLVFRQNAETRKSQDEKR